ncbi:Dos2-interacting transcription regulator of RNA-Pol-II-domain-containing protein [Lasiosphaeria hispida]|uniref:MMS19 nucleotide excision repair protein n=1 Tax=Lasiosphaeria hispida TaxID=260671 RepID=A0AAJ0HUQ7_9PEZI|nr:Dos2-interacting transcription regulator of RNA-Pol-II-domain-containing protein [Lasiosphaeria hispida]
MANFKDWALQYVLSDEEPAQREIAAKAAKEIESSGASRTVVGNWAASVQPWMTRAQSDHDDQMDDGEDGGGGDIIARAKALGFLAGTLETLDRKLLKTDQVVFLVGFFGAMFSYDHKAGITASAKALRQLYAMKGFKPDMGVKMIEDVSKLKEDFRLQTASTRLGIYELFLGLIQDPAVSSELQHKYGSSCGFTVDLLQLCQNERDPRNLMLWFKIIAVLLADYSTSTEVTEEIFKAVSAYFPISLRSSATPIGITAKDLKGAVRACFSAHQRLSTLTFPFLMQKLDQGDAVTVAVKVDILKTTKACIEQYENPQTSVVPHIEKIWNSLKYEVRNGEVKETIEATLEVLQAIANKLDGFKTQKLDVSLLKSYVDLVFKDCRDDLANPTYTKQAGLLLMTVITSNVRAYMLESASFVGCIRQNFRQPKSPSHTRDLVLILNSFLKARLELVRNRSQGHPEDEKQLKTEPRVHLDALFHDVYLGIWTAKANEPNSENIEILKQVTQGLALLANQQVVQQDGSSSLLCSGKICSEICTLLTQCLVKGLTLSSNDNTANDATFEEEALLALRSLVMVYTPAYEEFVRRATTEIRSRDWENASSYSLDALKSVVSRLAFVGCSQIPSRVASDTTSSKSLSPLQHFITLTTAVLEIFPLSAPGPGTKALANSYAIAGIHAALLFFRDACTAKYQPEAVVSYSKSDKNWIEEFGQLPDDWLQKLQVSGDETLGALNEDDPEVYRQFLRLSLYVVRHLYRTASSGTQSIWTGRILGQLADIAALVIRNLGEQLQISCNLAHEAFNFFAGPQTQPSKHISTEPFIELLTRGVLEGLWPGAMVNLYNPGGIAEKFLCNTDGLEPFLGLQSDIRASIGSILANKYKGGPSTSDPESQTVKRVLGFWGEQINKATTSDGTDPKIFQALNNIAMHIVAGAAARQDKAVIDLIPVFQAAIGSEHANSETVARSLGTLVKDSEVLKTDNHAVIRRFNKQWAYSHLAKPLYPLASPSADGASAAMRYRTAILSIVSNCPFNVYEADVEPLVRLLITTLTDRSGLSQRVPSQRLVSALEILVEILSNEPDALKGHLKAIISGGMKIYEECLPENQDEVKTGGKAAPRRNLVMARKLVLQVLGAVPKKFEERYLLPYSLQLQRMLGLSCGDPVREVRQIARFARGNWLKVV